MARFDEKTNRSEWALRGLAGLLAVLFLVGVAACGDGVPEAEATVTLSEAAPFSPPKVATESGETEASEVGEAPASTVVPRTPTPPRVVTYEEAELAYRSDDFGAATDLFLSYTDRKPENPWGFYMLGLSAWKAGHPDRAETALRESVRLDPNHVKGHVNLARVLLDGGQVEGALEHAELAEDLDPASGQAKRMLARARAENGDLGGALAMYEKALRIDPDDAWTLNNMGYLLVREGRYEEAVGPLALAVSVDGGNALFLNNLGTALERAGHTVAAVEAFNGAVELDSGYGKAVDSLVRLQAVVGLDEVPEVDVIALGADFRKRLVGEATQAAAPPHGKGNEPE